VLPNYLIYSHAGKILPYLCTWGKSLTTSSR
jgi:hypothetical protein